VVEVKNISKKYGSNIALNDVSFSVSEGEVLGFLGPNGAGKSTTMNIITGFLAPTSGTVCVDGLDVLEFPLECKKRIGYLPEKPPLYPEMTVKSYLSFMYGLKKLKGSRNDKSEALAKIEQETGLVQVEKRLIRNLSKGYQQRVGLAQALLGEPPVLILDEPTVGLDPVQIMEIRELVKKAGKKSAVIFSTHILQEAAAVCTRIMIINGGKITAGGTVEELCNQYNVKTLEEAFVQVLGAEAVNAGNT
jgi:ABC-2 type transport system ATP-binding protein